MPKFPGLLYSEVRTGLFKLYVYTKDGRGYDIDTYFEKKPRYPDEEIFTVQAEQIAKAAITTGREVRVTDGADFLVYHFMDGAVQYGEKFWDEVDK